MMNFYLLLVLLSSVYAETEEVKTTVKVGKTKFKCTFTLASDGGNVTLNESKVVCTPNKPTKKKVQDYEIFTDTAVYNISFNINPEKLTKASMVVNEKEEEPCEAGYTRVCPSGADGACPDGMFNFCPYDGSPGAEADAWDCTCLATRMLELDIQAGLNPLGECHEECVCLDGDVEAITNKQKPTFFGPKQLPSYCNQ